MPFLNPFSSSKLDSIIERLDKMTINEGNLTTSVANLISVTSAVVNDLSALSAEVTSLKTSTSDPTAQAGLDSLQQKIDAQVAALSTAVAANQP